MALDAQGNEVGKLFVGGLHQSTSTEGLSKYFAKFGEIEESIVMMDNRTGRSRGFGYVKFKEPSAVDQVLAEKIHIIDNKEVDPKKCNINMRGKNRRSLKIFVGGIAFEHDEETIRNFFQTFGTVTDVNLLSNPGRQRHRGFAFVGFDDEEVVKKLIKMHYANLNGKQVEIKPMEPPNLQKPSGFMPLHGGLNPQHGTGRPVRGGGRMNPVHPHNYPYGTWNQWPNATESGNWNPPRGPMPPQGPQNQSWNPSLWSGPGSGSGGISNHGHSTSVSNPAGIPNGVGWGNHIGMQANGVPPPWGPQGHSHCLPNRRSGASGPHPDQLGNAGLEHWQPQPSGPPAMCQLDTPHQFTTPLNCAAPGAGNSWNQHADSLQSHWGTSAASVSTPGSGLGMSLTTGGSGNGTSLWNEPMQPNGSAMAAMAAAGLAGLGPSPGQAFKMDEGLYGTAAANFCLPSSNNAGHMAGNDWQSVAAAAQRNYHTQPPQVGLCKRL
ncbi:DAZ-associated protein 1 [Sparganum proliferum]